VYLFGIVDESKNRQTNYLVDEFDMAKGANEVVSMLWHYLQNNRNTIKSKWVLNADNMTGQNKNNTLMRFLAGLCVTNFVDEIEIKFMVVGHTHFLVDANFGHIKRKYRGENAYIIEHLANIVTASADSNEAVILTHKKIFNFTEGYTSPDFVAIPKIASKHYFKFMSDKPWIALVKSNLDDNWEEVSLIKKNTHQSERVKISARIKLLKHLPPVGISTSI